MNGDNGVLAILDAEAQALADEGYRVAAAKLRGAKLRAERLAWASGAGLADLQAMTAAADRGEVWTVNAGARLRLQELAAALADFITGGAA